MDGLCEKLFSSPAISGDKNITDTTRGNTSVAVTTRKVYGTKWEIYW